MDMLKIISSLGAQKKIISISTATEKTHHPYYGCVFFAFGCVFGDILRISIPTWLPST